MSTESSLLAVVEYLGIGEAEHPISNRTELYKLAYLSHTNGINHLKVNCAYPARWR